MRVILQQGDGRNADRRKWQCVAGGMPTRVRDVRVWGLYTGEDPGVKTVVSGSAWRS